MAIVPACRAERTIGAALESLRIANASFVDRVLVVTSSDDPTVEVVRAWARRDPRVELHTAARRRSAGAARNDGRRAVARAGDAAELLLFMDADCRLEPGGARALAEEMAREKAAAISARVVCDSTGAVARCRHILEFKEAASRRDPPRAWLPPSTTLMCSAAAFDRAGGFPDQWPGEDLVFAQVLRAQGDRVLRSRRTATRHAHPAGLTTMLAHQLRLGRTAAEARRRIEMPGSALARRPWMAPLLFPARILRTARWQVGEGPAAAGLGLLLSPLLVVGLAAWTAGFLAGALGPPPNRRRVRGPSTEEHARLAQPLPSGTAAVVAVVPVFNGECHLPECLRALLASDPCLRVLVVDDASGDSSLAVARRLACDPSSAGRVQVLALDRNVGFAGAVNRGVERAMEPELTQAAFLGGALGTLILVNQDCFVSPGWLAPLLDALDRPDVAIAGARLFEEDGATVQHDGARVEPNGLTTHLGRGRPDQEASAELLDVDYVCGALMALRVSTWRSLGPLDEGYGVAYYEDVDYCARARARAGRVVVAARSQARHVEASTSGRGSTTYLRRYHRSRLRFVVRRQAREVGWASWLGHEVAWLVRLRAWRQVEPVLGAYARVPGFVLEVVRERLVAPGRRPGRGRQGSTSVTVAEALR